MNKRHKKTIHRMIDHMNDHISALEEIITSENERLKTFSSRELAMSSRGEKIEADIVAMDIARVNLNLAIEDLSKTIE